MLAKLTSKNQLTLPKAVMSVVEGSNYLDVTEENGRIVLTAGTHEPRRRGARQAGRARRHGGRCGRCSDLGAPGRMTLERFVLDTNVLLSALLFHAASLS